MENIFGYSFEEIKAVQQGGRLGRVVDVTKPPIEVDKYAESDMALLKEHGEQNLRNMGYMGVIDRLQRSGKL